MKLKSYMKKILYVGLLLLFCYNVQSQQRAFIPPVNSSKIYSASSYMPESYGISYFPSLAGDQSLNTWWSPSSNDRETCWLQINFSEKKRINNIKIHAGSHYLSFKNLGNLYLKNLRIRYANLEFSDGSSELIELDDIDNIQTKFFNSRFTKFVRIRPTAYYPSTKWNDPCVSFFNAGYEQ
jgi:hypothetical protein